MSDHFVITAPNPKLWGISIYFNDSLDPLWTFCYGFDGLAISGHHGEHFIDLLSMKNALEVIRLRIIMNTTTALAACASKTDPLTQFARDQSAAPLSQRPSRSFFSSPKI